MTARNYYEAPLHCGCIKVNSGTSLGAEAFMQRSETLSNDGSRTPAFWEHQGASMTKKITLEQKWRKLSEAAKKEAETLPHGNEREALLKKARQLETASQIDQWISSPALQPPT
jgi:hypothetical protein